MHHGRPWQALCLWSLEVIDAFQAAGHPIAPGLAGENITVSGLHWPDVRPGVRIQIGEVLCEISSYAIPCSQNSGWFLDGEFTLMHHDRGPVSRVYATVLEPGRIATGDAAILEP
jgi:MOSC domain-containing protein YiiM